MLEVLVHAADISNPLKPKPIAVAWTDRIVNEFCAQGDLERAAGSPISPMCDRNTLDVTTMQLGFMDFVITPLATSLIGLFPSLHGYGLYLAGNYARFALKREQDLWAADAAATAAEKKEGGGGGGGDDDEEEDGGTAEDNAAGGDGQSGLVGVAELHQPAEEPTGPDHLLYPFFDTRHLPAGSGGGGIQQYPPLPAPPASVVSIRGRRRGLNQQVFDAAFPVAAFRTNAAEAALAKTTTLAETGRGGGGGIRGGGAERGRGRGRRGESWSPPRARRGSWA